MIGKDEVGEWVDDARGDMKRCSSTYNPATTWNYIPSSGRLCPRCLTGRLIEVNVGVLLNALPLTLPALRHFPAAFSHTRKASSRGTWDRHGGTWGSCCGLAGLPNTLPVGRCRVHTDPYNVVTTVWQMALHKVPPSSRYYVRDDCFFWGHPRFDHVSCMGPPLTRPGRLPDECNKRASGKIQLPNHHHSTTQG